MVRRREPTYHCQYSAEADGAKQPTVPPSFVFNVSNRYQVSLIYISDVFLEFPIEHKAAHKADILFSEKFRRNETGDPSGFR